MTPSEREAYRKGFEKAKAECIQVVDEWSRSCHPTHPRPAAGGKYKCWQHHGLRCAKRSIQRDVKLVDVEVAKPKPPFKIAIEKLYIGEGRPMVDMEKALSPAGDYIGDPQFATDLWQKYGITKFELRVRRCNVCSVGYSPATKQWYGWSHRAIKGFKTRADAAKFAAYVS